MKVVKFIVFVLVSSLLYAAIILQPAPFQQPETLIDYLVLSCFSSFASWVFVYKVSYYK